MKKSYIRLGIWFVIGSALIWQCIGAWQDSQTTDEAVHLTAGRSYWQTGEFWMNPEHPALFKLWAALPLALMPQTQIDTDTEVWRSGNQWTIGSYYMYYGTAQHIYGPRFLLFLGRIQMILLWLALIVTLSVFSWRRWGAWPSLAVATFAAYDPNLLGHGHLITNDLATSFAYLGAWLAVARFIQRPTWSTLTWFSVVFALAQLTKFSAAILWILMPIFFIVARWYGHHTLNRQWIIRAAIMCVAVTSLMTWAVYGFRIDRINNDPRIAQLWSERQAYISQGVVNRLPAYTQTFIRLADPTTLSGKFLNTFQYASVPGYWYWRGFFSAASHNVYGHGAYLLGRVSLLGWWYYFPVALAVKTPILLLGAILLVGGLSLSMLITGLRRKQNFRQIVPFDAWVLGWPPLIYLLWSMTSHINIGVRHVFPVYIFFPLAVGSLVSLLQRQTPRFVPLAVTATTLITILVSTLAWPNTIGYYNGWFGGTEQGHRYVLDSNLDWNQDIWRLRFFLNQHRFNEVHIALFGSIPTDRIFPEQLSILQNNDIARGIQPSGIIAISQGQLYNVDGPFAWLRGYQPRWRVGSSINVYDFR